jgi:hypothetical protein
LKPELSPARGTLWAASSSGQNIAVTSISALASAGLQLSTGFRRCSAYEPVRRVCAYAWGVIMKIQNQWADELNLTKLRLIHVDDIYGLPYYINLNELKKAFRTRRIVTYFLSYGWQIGVSCSLEDRRIGCCQFNEKNFAKILKVAKLTKSGKKK